MFADIRGWKNYYNCSIRIEIDDDFEDWDGVENEYHDDVNDIANRHAKV